MDWTLTIVFIASGLLMIGLAIPMIRGNVTPNHWYGFRVKRTVEDPQIWYPANTYAGKLMVVYGVVLVLAAIVLPFVLPDLAADTLAWIMVAILLGGLPIVVLLSWRYLRTL